MKQTMTRLAATLLFAGLFTALWIPTAQAQGPMPLTPQVVTPAPGQFNNMIRFSLFAPSVDGDVAQYMQRQRVPGDLFGGLEALHLERFVGESGLFVLNGRAIPANDEYKFNGKLEVPDVGFAAAGINNFKVRYDGDGGYYAPTSSRFAPREEELAMDRGRAWVEGGLRLPSAPELTVRYDRQFRKGQKPSLSWGDASIDGAGNKNIVPSFWDSDEVRNTVSANAAQTFGDTRLNLGFRYETGDSENSLNVWRRPGESAERFLTDTEIAESNLLNVTAGAVTRIGANVMLTTHYSYADIQNDISGDRIYGSGFGASFNPAFPGAQRRDHGFINVMGMVDRKVHSGGLSLRWASAKGLTIVPGLRIDSQEISGIIDLIDTNAQGNGTTDQTPLTNSNSRKVTDFSGSLEVRYTGLDRVVLYARGDAMDRSGDIEESEVESATGAVEFERRAKDTKSAQKYTVGFNWTPNSLFRIGAQAYLKSRSVEYDHTLNADGPLTYPGFLQAQDFNTSDANVQIRWRPIPRFTLTSRFDAMHTSIEGTAESLGSYESASIKSTVFTNSFHFAPVVSAYLRGSISISTNSYTTPINELTGAVANIVPKSTSDYISGNVSGGVAVSATLDLEAQYFYYESDNFVDNSDVGLPYGIAAKEQGFSAGGSYLFKPELTLSARFYHFLNRDTTFGGTQDYDMNLVYVGVQYHF